MVKAVAGVQPSNGDSTWHRKAQCEGEPLTHGHKPGFRVLSPRQRTCYVQITTLFMVIYGVKSSRLQTNSPTFSTGQCAGFRATGIAHMPHVALQKVVRHTHSACPHSYRHPTGSAHRLFSAASQTWRPLQETLVGLGIQTPIPNVCSPPSRLASQGEYFKSVKAYLLRSSRFSL